MNARSFSVVKTVCAVLILPSLVAIGACSNGKPAEPPNLLIIVSDALRADVLGCYGGAARTPNIDRLAASGTRFQRCYSTTPWTWPSAVSMFTGNYPSSYRSRVDKLFPERRPEAPPVTLFHVPKSELLLGEVLRSAGYQVRMALQNQLPRQSNSLQGFEELDYTAAGAEPPSRRSPQFLALLDYLHRVPGDQPFCLLGWVLDPHGEYDPPRRFRQRIDIGGQPLPRERRFYAKLNSRQLKDHTGDLDARERAYIQALYRAEVEYVDQRVGMILGALTYSGLLEKTLVVFTSDHGEAFWEHGYPSHGNTYFEEMVRVPLIFSGPGIPSGQQVETPVSHLDLAPTLARLLGIDLPGGMQGTSYADLLSGTAVHRDPVYFIGAHQQLQVDAILHGPHKLIVGVDGSKALYDLTSDPKEERNLATDSPEVVERLEGRLLKIREENLRMRKSRPQPGDTSDPTDNRDLLKQMKALGYVE
jgi:arylsulfatase A-like enzyme